MIKSNRKVHFLLLTGLFLSALCYGYADPYTDLNIDFLLNDTTKVQSKKPLKSKKKDEKKLFKNVIKDYQKIDGLFTIYWNDEKNKAFLAILPDQIEKIHLAGLTRQSGDGYYLDGSSMLDEYPFMFKQVGERVQFVNVNVKFRTDEDSQIGRASCRERV